MFELENHTIINMGLFGAFGKKKMTHEEKVSMAYKCYKPELVSSVFPAGKTQASDVVLSLGKIYGINLEAFDANAYREILTTYSDVVIRRVVTMSNDEHIMASLQAKHKEFVKNKSIARKVLAYVVLNMKNNRFALRNDSDLQTLMVLVESFKDMEQVASENVAVENNNTDDPEYGLVVNKPIYTQGVNGSNQYLERLKTEDGETLLWKRVGSTTADGINGIIDIYRSTLPSGKPYKTLYLNMYGSSNSTKAPKGFVQKNMMEFLSKS